MFNELEEALGPTAGEVVEDQAITYTRKKLLRPRIDESLPTD